MAFEHKCYAVANDLGMYYEQQKDFENIKKIYLDENFNEGIFLFNNYLTKNNFNIVNSENYFIM